MNPYVFFFFFSSRRRHTRWNCDWSSDVCSSDLTAGWGWLPVRRSWRLNERHYGALQGKNKAQTRAEFGDEQFMLWRRSYDVPPPPLADDDPYSQAGDPRYALLPPELMPRTECLKDVLTRLM